MGHALAAVRELDEVGAKFGLLNMHTIKPLDAKAIAHCVENCERICVIEEHTSVGGLGSAVLQHINENHPDYRGRVLLHSIADKYVQTGNYAYLLEMNKLDASGIREFLRDRVGAP